MPFAAETARWCGGGPGRVRMGARVRREGKISVSGVRDKDGKLLWATEIAERDVDKARDRSYTASTPTMDGERVYALTKGGFLACLKAATGERVWQKSYKHDFGGVRPW